VLPGNEPSLSLYRAAIGVHCNLFDPVSAAYIQSSSLGDLKHNPLLITQLDLLLRIVSMKIDSTVDDSTNLYATQSSRPAVIVLTNDFLKNMINNFKLITDTDKTRHSIGLIVARMTFLSMDIQSWDEADFYLQISLSTSSCSEDGYKHVSNLYHLMALSAKKLKQTTLYSKYLEQSCSALKRLLELEKSDQMEATLIKRSELLLCCLAYQEACSLFSDIAKRFASLSVHSQCLEAFTRRFLKVFRESDYIEPLFAFIVSDDLLSNDMKSKVYLLELEYYENGDLDEEFCIKRAIRICEWLIDQSSHDDQTVYFESFIRKIKLRRFVDHTLDLNELLRMADQYDKTIFSSLLLSWVAIIRFERGEPYLQYLELAFDSWNTITDCFIDVNLLTCVITIGDLFGFHRSHQKQISCYQIYRKLAPKNASSVTTRIKMNQIHQGLPSLSLGLNNSASVWEQLTVSLAHCLTGNAEKAYFYSNFTFMPTIEELII
jgi:hypothetical protein